MTENQETLNPEIKSTSRLPVIETAGLKKVFKDFWGRPKVVALDGIDFKVHAGEVSALIGPNGSGKTTFIKILLGLLFPTKGSAKVFGEPCFEVSNKARIGFLPESNFYYKHLSGYETLKFHSQLLGLPKNKAKERIDYVLELTRMDKQAHRAMGEYSLGMTRRIGLAQALLADPELLILDEPTNGLDPIGIEEIHSLLLSLRNRGKTILICTHLLAETDEICNHIGMLLNGKMLTYGDLDSLHKEWQTSHMKELFMKVMKQGDYIPRKYEESKDDQGKKEELVVEEKKEQPVQGPDTDYLDSIKSE